MTPERHQQIKRLFLAAVELAPAQGQQFLDSACGEDVTLRLEVQTLLDHHRPETLLAYTQSAETAATAAAAPAAEEVPAALPAGTLVAERYRLAMPLGQGGMGVVYRAEDTELDQTIALKFLRPNIRELPGAVDYLRHEVRIARQITHPNVVRVFDLGTSAGEVFISMEFVAGEDLASLVRRVGSLAPAKVLQIARQLAAGLAAAHAANILHRDLKPANVMLDGAGDVRILDFGIATPQSDQRGLGAFAGTPGFLAPELLVGQRPSQRCDLYAWGLVVYFAATGKLPAGGLDSEGPSVNDALLSAGQSRELATCVAACLQADPEQRPRSAHELIAALAGDDPLREFVRAGQMPPAELVTAARSWRPVARVVDGLLAGGLVLLVLILLLGDRALFLSRCGLVKSPDALREIAEQTLDLVGCNTPSEPVLTGVTLDADCLQFVRGKLPQPAAWSRVSTGEIPAVFFWYRQGDPRLPRPTPLGENVWERLAQPTPGTATVRLDGRGKLLSLQIVGAAAGEPAARSMAWSRLFEAAGLPWPQFAETDVPRWPPLFADDVHAWEGPFPADPAFRVRVTAAALRGRIVFFDVDQPWEQSRALQTIAEQSNQATQFVAVRTALWLAAIGVAAALAWRHVQRGYADWLGAWRVAAGVMLLAGGAWLLGAPHNFVPSEELAAAFWWLSAVVFSGTAAGIAYLAVEPLARRWWPWSIITTRRLLEGRLADREIWADVLLGIVVGLGTVWLRQLATVANHLLGIPVSGLNDFDPGQNLLDQFGMRYKAVFLVPALQDAAIESLLLLTLIVAAKRVVKSTPVAAVLVVLVVASLAILGRGLVSPVDWAARTLLLAIAAWLLLRHGLLTTTAALATFYAVNNTPLTLEWTRWYAPTGFFVAATLAAALALCWRRSRPAR